jgi:hypothetical protein
MKTNHKWLTSHEQDVDYLLNRCLIYTDKPIDSGGQHCGNITFPIIIESKDMDIKISVGTHKANYKNKQVALELMEIALNKVIK